MLYVSFIEIYKDYIYDLFQPLPKGKNKKRATLRLGENKNVSFVKDLRQIQVKIVCLWKQRMLLRCFVAFLVSWEEYEFAINEVNPFRTLLPSSSQSFIWFISFFTNFINELSFKFEFLEGTSLKI